MIVLFNISIAELESADRSLLAAKFTEIVRAHRLGYHLIVINREICDWIFKNVYLTADNVAVLHRISTGYTQVGALPRKARIKVQITRLQGSIQNIDDATIDIPLHFDQLEDLLSKPLFIVEDIVNDGNMYKFIFDVIGQKVVRGRYSFDIANGGGERTLDTTIEMSKSNRMIVTFFDSDRRSPVSPNTKLERFEAATVDLSNPFVQFFQTPCRELENLIHPNAIRLARDFQSAARNFPFWRSLSADSDLDDSVYEVWRWIDLKNGICTVDIVSLVNTAERQWIAKQLIRHGVNVHDFDIRAFGPRLCNVVLRRAENRNLAAQQMLRPETFSMISDFMELALWTFVSGERYFA